MENINLLPENEYTEVENRRYINPTLVPTETEDFITKFRDTQKGNNQEIISQTQALGTDVPSNIGGLTGAGSYFTSRYQTPQTNTVTQNLRTAAQQTALNEALQNEQAMWKKRYQDAYNSYQKRQNNKTNSGGGGTLDDILKRLGIDVNPDDGTDNTVNENTNTGPEKLSGMGGDLLQYTDANGGRWTLRNLSAGDELMLGGLTSVGGNLQRAFPDGTPLTHGAVYNAGNGRVFMYLNNDQTGGGTIYRVGDSPTISYR